jgi:hypothetical protein
MSELTWHVGLIAGGLLDAPVVNLPRSSPCLAFHSWQPFFKGPSLAGATIPYLKIAREYSTFLPRELPTSITFAHETAALRKLPFVLLVTTACEFYHSPNPQNIGKLSPQGGSNLKRRRIDPSSFDCWAETRVNPNIENIENMKFKK